jgi:hypothetical protein
MLPRDQNARDET